MQFSDFVTKMQSLRRRSVPAIRRELEKFNKIFDVSDAIDTLDQFEYIERSDYEEYEEYREEKEYAWQEFLIVLDEIQYDQEQLKLYSID